MRRLAMALAILVAGALSARAADMPVAPSANTEDWIADFDTMVAAMKATHPSLYHHTSAAEMDAYAARFRGEIAHDTWPEYVMGMYGMLALVGDGHTTFYPQPDAGPGFDTRYPVLTQVFADGVYVTGADKAYAGAVGGKVVALSGHPIGEVFAATSAHWDHENLMWPLRWFPFVLRRPGYLSGLHITPRDVGAAAVFTVEKDGKQTDYAVTPVAADADTAAQADWVHARDEAHVPQPFPLSGKDVPFDFVWLAGKRTVYAVYNQCSDSDTETVAAFAARLFRFVDANPVDRLIIDVRHNGGGDNYKNQPLILGMIASKVNVPGHLFVLTGRQTFSAAQNFAADAERWTQALFVGEPTGSAPNIWGDAKQMELPHTHLHPMVATLYWEQSDPRDVRPWILPDVPAPATFADYLSGRDPALEAALAWRAEGATQQAPNLHWIRASQKAGWPLPF
jgi:hypothetical protein